MEMDQFGIGHGVAGAAEIYFRSGRGTGRTASLIDSLKDGDRVVFLTSQESRRVKSLCKDRGIDIAVTVADPVDPSTLFMTGTPRGAGRTVFDHGWVEEFYLRRIKQARLDIDKLQAMISGSGEPHRTTKIQAQERAKWDF
jgi:hypothetical protein